MLFFYKIFFNFFGSESILIPSDSKTSKLPDFEVTLLLPCFTIFTLKVDKRIDVAVEKLKLFLLSPPVPHVSIKSLLNLILKILLLKYFTKKKFPHMILPFDLIRLR